MDSYGKPWFRIHAFVIGIAFGFFLVDYKPAQDRLRFSWILSFFTWLMIATLVAVTMWLPFTYTIGNNQRDPNSQQLYQQIQATHQDQGHCYENH